MASVPSLPLAKRPTMFERADAVARRDGAAAVLDLAGDRPAAGGDGACAGERAAANLDELGIERAAVKLRSCRPLRC